MSYPLFTDSELDNLFRRVAKQMEIHLAAQTGWSDQGFQSLASKGVLTCGLASKATGGNPVPANRITPSLTLRLPLPEEQSNDYFTSRSTITDLSSSPKT